MLLLFFLEFCGVIIFAVVDRCCTVAVVTLVACGNVESIFPSTVYHTCNNIFFQILQVPPPNLPQIIGLSASLGIGTGNSGSGNKAETHIMGLCANLDAHELMVSKLN